MRFPSHFYPLCCIFMGWLAFVVSPLSLYITVLLYNIELPEGLSPHHADYTVIPARSDIHDAT